jgi:hypothetical protein
MREPLGKLKHKYNVNVETCFKETWCGVCSAGVEWDQLVGFFHEFRVL